MAIFVEIHFYWVIFFRRIDGVTKHVSRFIVWFEYISEYNLRQEVDFTRPHFIYYFVKSVKKRL